MSIGLHVGGKEVACLQAVASSHSELSQRFEDYNLANDGALPDSELSIQQITPDTTIQAESSNSKKKWKN